MSALVAAAALAAVDRRAGAPGWSDGLVLGPALVCTGEHDVAT